MIKKYNDFVKEKYNVYQNDPTELASDKSYFNKSESDIKEFLTKKTIIDNIYKTYTDEKDLIKKLSAQKFIPINTSDKKKIQFINPLIGLYASSAEKSRELRSLESELGTQTDTLSQRKSAIGTNPDAIISLQNDVAYTQGKISDINSRIAKLKNEIVTLERNTRDKLKQMKDSIANNKKKLDYFIKTK